jgi:hypothetical protein
MKAHRARASYLYRLRFLLSRSTDHPTIRATLDLAQLEGSFIRLTTAQILLKFVSHLGTAAQEGRIESRLLGVRGSDHNLVCLEPGFRFHQLIQ